MQPGNTINPSGGPPESSHSEPEQLVQIDHNDPVPEARAPQDYSSPPEHTEPSLDSTPIEVPTIESEKSFTPAPNLTETSPLTWTASEFIEHQKPHGWYATVAGVAVLVAGVLYFATRDVVTVVVVVMAAAMFGIVGARKPRALTYKVSSKGVQIGDKGFGYDKFKSFAIIEEGAIDSIQLMPLQRFMPPISLYFPPDQEKEITDLIGSYLPHEERNHDPIDRLMKRFRF